MKKDLLKEKTEKIKLCIFDFEKELVKERIQMKITDEIVELFALAGEDYL